MSVCSDGEEIRHLIDKLSSALFVCFFLSLIPLKLYRLSSIICWFKKFNMNNYSVQREVKWAFSPIIYGLRKFQITRHSKSFNTSLFIRLAAADLPDISIRPRFLPMILFSSFSFTCAKKSRIKITPQTAAQVVWLKSKFVLKISGEF